MTPRRYELKYWASTQQVDDLLGDLSGLIQAAPFTGKTGSYSVTSLYWDTPDYRFFVEKLDGIRERVKIRLRRYENNEPPQSDAKCQILHGLTITFEPTGFVSFGRET